ncbi:MAG: phosphotransferase [Mycoplasmatales bacterium]
MDKHQEALSLINKDYKIEHRFMGGMSNFTYLITDGKDKYTYRYPGNGANNFVDYNIEKDILDEAYKFNLTNETIFLDTATGQKIGKYVEGKNLTEVNIDYDKAANLLKEFHACKFTSMKDYDQIGRLNKYESLHSNGQVEYNELKEYFVNLFNKELKQYCITPCHNDSQLSNFIEQDNGNYKIVDFEYAAINDVIYDIACFGNKDFNNAKDLITYYFNEVGYNEMLRLYAWRMFQCLQWFNVASFKEEIGLSKDLGIDFKAVASNYINLARGFKEDIEKLS